MAVRFRWVALGIATTLSIVALGVAPTLRAQSDACVQEVEPNDTPATANPVVGPGCIEGSLGGQDQNEVLQPEFVVFDPEGTEVARGRVNTDAVAVPSGVYRVQVLSTPGRTVEGVQVVEREVGLTVALRD